MKSLLIVAACVHGVVSQDPAGGWMAYAVGDMPAKYERITRLEMTWKVSESPKRSYAFYSPWFGMDPADNLNLIQPVNPWSGTAWSMYTEYYQWSPTHNSNSRQNSVESGQTLHGSLVYNPSADSYTLSQEVVETGATSEQEVICQKGKKFTVPYVVYEKTYPCKDYPPDGKVVFYDIVAECDNVDCSEELQWDARVRDDNCNMAANIIDAHTISLTWDTSMGSKYDNMTRTELHKLNMKGAWATDLFNLEDKKHLEAE